MSIRLFEEAALVARSANRAIIFNSKHAVCRWARILGRIGIHIAAFRATKLISLRWSGR